MIQLTRLSCLGNVDVVPTVTAQVNIDGPAQPYMPGPAIYQPPMIS